VSATRRPEQYGLRELQPYITFAPAARHHHMIEGARALAFLRGGLRAARDVIDLVPDVLRHRLC